MVVKLKREASDAISGTLGNATEQITERGEKKKKKKFTHRLEHQCENLINEVITRVMVNFQVGLCIISQLCVLAACQRTFLDSPFNLYKLRAIRNYLTQIFGMCSVYYFVQSVSCVS